MEERMTSTINVLTLLHLQVRYLAMQCRLCDALGAGILCITFIRHCKRDM